MSRTLTSKTKNDMVLEAVKKSGCIYPVGTTAEEWRKGNSYKGLFEGFAIYDNIEQARALFYYNDSEGNTLNIRYDFEN